MPQATIIKSDTDVDPGLCILEYSLMGIGKTDSILTLPDPLLIISNEEKDIKRTIKEHMKRNNQKDRNIEVRDHYKNFDDYLTDLNALDAEYKSGNKPFRSVAFDTLSNVQSNFKIELEDSRVAGEPAVDPWDIFHMEKGDAYTFWRGVGSLMIRLTKVLNRLSKYGVYVLVTSMETAFPKYDKTLEAAPDFEGGFQSKAGGYFDLVVRLTPGEDEVYPYPPIIHFTGKDIVTRCSSDALIRKGKGVLKDWKLILKMIES
jgi:hypothetical protein